MFVCVFRPWYVARLKQVNKFNLVDVLANTRDDPPVFYPIHEPSQQEIDWFVLFIVFLVCCLVCALIKVISLRRHTKAAAQFDLTKFASAQAKRKRTNDAADGFRLSSALDYTSAYSSGKVTPLQAAQRVRPRFVLTFLFCLLTCVLSVNTIGARVKRAHSAAALRSEHERAWFVLGADFSLFLLR